jgi:gamma-glutamylcyclotransferase (GGCT)/AIG2-like uncharacterized protein YtfP
MLIADVVAFFPCSEIRNYDIGGCCDKGIIMKAATPSIPAILNVPLFVYGTLMSPVVMESLIQRRVHGHPVRLLPSYYAKVSSAQVSPVSGSNEKLSYDYSRHPVRNAVYPGLVHWDVNNESESKQTTRDYVCGLLYYNLTDEEMVQLDEFEGDQYVKELCYVKMQRNTENFNDLDETLQNSSDDVVQAMVYVWSNPISGLDLSKDWSYSTFEEQHLATYI